MIKYGYQFEENEDTSNVLKDTKKKKKQIKKELVNKDVEEKSK